MAWTTQQQNAIDACNCNLLVSAAAGSGKTAVLIERIIRKVLDENKPTDIDSIVVVTFTRAAAEEMKTRLGNAFEMELRKNPGNRHLLKQLSLLDNARISTIDKFCTYIIRNYYNTISLEPDFRVADEGELSLIREDVIQEILEEKFHEGRKEFIDFVEAFVPGKRLDRFSDYILRLYRFSQSNPWPLEWLDECKKAFSTDSAMEYEKLPIVRYILDYVRQLCRECADECKIMLEYCNEMSGPQEYIPAIESDMDRWNKCANAESLDTVNKILSIKDDNLKKSGADEELREKVKEMRNKNKKRKAKILNEYCVDIATQFEQMMKCRAYADIYLELVVDFTNRFKARKKEKNIVDFSDIEHYALDILINRDNGENAYTEIADELAKSFNEIYIDEYQDSNLVQEYILNAVSKERFGTPNIFMVGDVKQSIYKFRMAKPELFMDKYTKYPLYDSDNPHKYCKIELHKNFRSRENVLESINDVFHAIMKKTVGGIDYTEEVRLNAGKTFEGKADETTELLLIDKSVVDDELIDKTEASAHVIADRIIRLKNDNPSLKYSDCAILIRSDKSPGPVYASVLASHGIPAIYESSTGYFTASEIVKVIDFLRVIDNPRQEIPLAGLMRSYWAYFSAEEMARVKGARRKTELYDCVKEYAAKDDELGDKCRGFLELINDYRNKSELLTIHELITDIIYHTGYYDYIGAMMSGESRRANLDMLVVKAKEFENTSYLGVFNFIRYIDKLQKYDVDYGTDNTTQSSEDAVRIMSIHKSKGLEFPVVIITEFAKRYNLSDINAPIIYDGDYGIAMNYVDLNRRVKEDVVYKNLIGNKIKSDGIGEELRVLYVAMTRAVDKLIMVGVTDIEKSLEKWEFTKENAAMESNYLMENINYLDLVAPIALNNNKFTVKYISEEYLDNIVCAAEYEMISDITDISLELVESETDEELYYAIKKKLEYKYPHSNILSVKSKYSVSDLKHKAMEESDNLEARVELPERIKPVPSFVREAEEVSGISRGNAYHKFFELLNYDCTDSLGQIQKQLEALVSEGKLTQEYAEIINCNKFLKFINTDLGQDMKKAFQDKQLYREQPFIMEIGANEVDADYPQEEKVLVQGIIDAFYIKAGKVYIVDYKTDSVPKDSGSEVLIRRYRRQLELYADAIKKVTGKEVADCCMYSVALDKAISIY